MLENPTEIEPLRLRVGCDVRYKLQGTTPLVFLVQAQQLGPHQQVLQETSLVEPHVPVDQVRDAYGNPIWRVVAPAGELHLRYDAVVAVPKTPDPVLPALQKTTVDKLPGELLSYIWPTRYCPSDRLIGEAWRLFGDVPGGWAQAQAVCDWIHSNIEYGSGSTSATDALEVFNARRGVCRDFAHLGITFCRALNMPARYVCGYLPDYGVEPVPIPMDFHAWFEVWLDGAWRTFDARHNTPRIGRVIIATGRDAVDGAWVTVFGGGKLTRFEVWADEAEPQNVPGEVVASPAS